MRKLLIASSLLFALTACQKSETSVAAPVTVASVNASSIIAEPVIAQSPLVENSASIENAVVAEQETASEPIAETPVVGGEIKKPEPIYKAGVDYRVLDVPVPTTDSSRIEVVEVFSYHCGHCFNFEPILHPWKQRLPKDVNFIQTHAIWNQSMEVLARAYYTAVALRIADKAHMAAFNHLHIDRKPLNTADQWADFLSQFGVQKDVILKTFNSLGVTNMVSQAKARVGNYKISGTPELVIEGKYGVAAGGTKTQADMLSVADYLIQLSRYERAQKAK